MASSVIENAQIVEHDQVVGRSLAFVGGRVSPAATDALHIDLADHLIIPGLINAHDHLQLNGIPPLEHATPFANSYAWIDAVEAHRRRPDVAAATAVPSAVRHWHGGLKNLMSGATTVAHHDPWHPTLDDPAFPVGVLRDFGWSHSLGLSRTLGDQPPRYGPPTRESFAETRAEHPWIMHVAEGTDAVAAGELSQLDALGCLGPNTVLVHGVGLSHADVDLVIERGAAVVWCPASNLAMFGRTLDRQTVRRLFIAGRLALGSDSRLTGSRDLLSELRIAAAHSNLSPGDLLRLVTCAPSRILRMPDHGGLKVGQRADCFVVRTGADAHTSSVGVARNEIRAVVRGGVPLIADADFAEWFAHCGVDVAEVRLDGRRKLIARQLVTPEAIALEPGLELLS